MRMSQKLGGPIKNTWNVLTQNWFARGIVSMLSCANIIFPKPNDVHPGGRWALQNQRRNQRNGTNASATWLLQKAQVLYTAKIAWKFSKTKSISWPSKKKQFHYVCKNTPMTKIESSRSTMDRANKLTPENARNLLSNDTTLSRQWRMHFTRFATGEVLQIQVWKHIGGSSNRCLSFTTVHLLVYSHAGNAWVRSLCWKWVFWRSFKVLAGENGS